MDNRFLRNKMLLGEKTIENISKKTIMIAGLGGVGGYAAEAIARLGFGTIIIVDFDIVDITNINRQIIAITSSIGHKKTKMFEQRILQINPEAKVVVYDCFIDEDHLSMFNDYQIDCVVDAIDSVNSKLALMKICLEKEIPIISSMGMANRKDPTKIITTTLNKTEGDGLAKKLRELGRKNNLDLKKIEVVMSKEQPLTCISKPLPSIMLTPAAAGLAIAYLVLNKFTS